MPTTDEDARALSSLRKKRGVIKRSLTRLSNNLRTVEATPDLDYAKQLIAKLESLDKEFKSLHFDIIDLVEEDSEDFEREQEALDKHEDDVSTMSLRLHQLIKDPPPAAASEKSASRKLLRVQECLQETEGVLAAMKDDHDEAPLLEQYQEQLSDVKKELSAIYEELINLDLPDGHALMRQHVKLERMQFDCSHHTKKLLSSHTTPAPKTPATTGDKSSKLPKLDVPSFDGNVLQWQKFWEQFEVSVNSRTSLSNAEKLVYLQQAIKNGSARTCIEGLSRTGDQYEEAIACLKGRYNRPRLIHRTHVRSIMEAPPLKEGNAKELRQLHDVLQQHLRALKSMKLEPDSSFITSIVELKLDATTLFEWQKHTQEKVEEVPPFQDVLEFLDLRAQASESLPKRSSPQQHGKKSIQPGNVASYTATNSSPSHCVVCAAEKHPLYMCGKFKSMPHDEMVSTLKKHNLCLNCFGSGHVARRCKSLHKCKRCQRPHHTLLHVESPGSADAISTESSPSDSKTVSHIAVKLKSSSLLMTCRVLVCSPDGSSVEARALLDSASTSSFVSERLVQSLRLTRHHQRVRISGIAGSQHDSPVQSIASFQISSVHSQDKKIDLTAIVLPEVTCNLPVVSVPFDQSWSHLSGLTLADPTFGEPQRIDLLLGVDIFVSILLHGRRTGPPGSPVAIETEFGWVLCGGSTVPAESVSFHVAAFHDESSLCTDDLLQKFWEIEELPSNDTSTFSLEERSVVRHFEVSHTRSQAGRFVVPLPRKPDPGLLGESRSQAVRRFLALERSLNIKGGFQEVNTVVQEYLDLGHAEAVPPEDMDKDPTSVFYLPMHVVYKSSSSTTKVRAVFDASAKSASGVSLNDTLSVGPTVHPSLVDVMLRFRTHRVALTADVSKMYRAIELTPSDRDYHRFVWRSDSQHSLQDFRMTRATFGVSASCFAANMSVKQNAMELAHKYPLAAETVLKSFYVDDCLTGADDTETAIELQRQLQDLFTHGGFWLRKWNSSDPLVLKAIWSEVRESKEIHTISDQTSCTKTLGVNWNTVTDAFHVTVPELTPADSISKRLLASDVAKVFDILGWFAPATITMKVLMQKVWELGISWDDPVPEAIHTVWSKWRSELPSLSTKSISRCYYPKDVDVVHTQLHGFSDASEAAYAGVVYLRMIDSNNSIHTTLVMAKTRVAPVKRLTIPRLELCGAEIVTRLLHKVRRIFDIPLSQVYAWTDSTIVLSWLKGNPRRFKTFVGNRIAEIVDKIPPERWNHVASADNPADCASRGVFPLELLRHDLWWTGPPWLTLEQWQWPHQANVSPELPVAEEREICCVSVSLSGQPVVPLDRYSSFTRLKRVVAWILRFVSNCRSSKKPDSIRNLDLTITELAAAEIYLVRFSQETFFAEEIASLEAGRELPRKSSLVPLHPFIDCNGVLRVGGREQHSQLLYAQMHPMILHSKHILAKLIVRSEHLRLLHAGPTLLSSTIAQRFYMIGMRKTVRALTRQCVICRRHSARPTPQQMGQLPIERVTPGVVFEKVGVDYAGPLQVKLGRVRKPVTVKAYLCIFVSLSVKAVHLEAVSDLTSEAFIATLRRFIARRGYPSLIWSDNGTNFVGASHDLKELYEFLNEQKTGKAVSQFCSSHKIEWRFIPERAPHFGGLWEAAVKSVKMHLKRIVGTVRLTFEELTTVLAQIEACLNSRPLVPVTLPDDDGTDVLTPGHFIIGRSMCALPDPAFSFRSVSLLRRWDLCQNLVRHFWQRWSTEYLTSLNKFNKWHRPARNFRIGDIVIIREDSLVPINWPIARVTEIHSGKDGLVRVATVKTAKGIYTRPANKLALLLPQN